MSSPAAMSLSITHREQEQRPVLVLAGETRVAEDIRHPEVLFFATLLHDVGKDKGGKDHAERGAVLAERIMGRLRFPDDAIARVQHLIRKHLRMYLIATRRDLDDPRTIEAFCEEVKDTEGLRELYLLTVSDVSTTSPTAMTNWKQRMLDELFYATDRWITLGETRRAAIDAVESGVRELLADEVSTEFADAFLTSMPPRYLGANNSEWIIRHMQLADQAQTLPAQITFVRRSDPHVELAVVTDDRPGALARICATFSRHKLKVVSAQIYAWTDPNGRRRVLDLFWVRSGQDPELVIELLPRLTDTLTSLVRGDMNEMDLVKAKRNEARWSLRPSPAVPIQVRIDNNGATRHTIMEVITKDRADLLFWISESIYRAGLSIDLAKIHTEGVRVTDVFYVCTADGTKVADEKLLDELKQQITQRLQDLEEGNEQ